jgi:hypothetical protein
VYPNANCLHAKLTNCGAATIVQGRYDVVCPPKAAWDLHQAFPEAKMVWIPDAGHGATVSWELKLVKPVISLIPLCRNLGPSKPLSARAIHMLQPNSDSACVSVEGEASFTTQLRYIAHRYRTRMNSHTMMAPRTCSIAISTQSGPTHPPCGKPAPVRNPRALSFPHSRRTGAAVAASSMLPVSAVRCRR